MKIEKRRVSFIFSKHLADELRRIIPANEISLFVENVLTRELRRRKLRKVLKKSYGAWKDKNHPELATFEDINRWVEEGRKRFTRIFD